jgi:hypothetical protein
LSWEKRLIDLIVKASLQRGLNPAISLRIGTLLETAGLTKVKTSTHIIPFHIASGQHQ